jgi:hypothetical protein
MVDMENIYSSKIMITLNRHQFYKIVKRIGMIRISKPDEKGIIRITYPGSNIIFGEGSSVEQALDDCWKKYQKAREGN